MLRFFCFEVMTGESDVFKVCFFSEFNVYIVISKKTPFYFAFFDFTNITFSRHNFLKQKMFCILTAAMRDLSFFSFNHNPKNIYTLQFFDFSPFKFTFSSPTLSAAFISFLYKFSHSFHHRP